MAGHLYRLPGEKGWRVQIDIGVDPGTGRRVRVKLPGRRKAPFPTKREAEHAAAQALLERAASGGVAETRYATVSEFLLQRWLPARRARGLKPTTLSSYEWIIRKHIIPNLGSLKLRDVKPHHVTTMIVSLAAEPGRGGRARSARTLQLIRRVLSMAMADALRWGLLYRNPVTAAEADLPRAGSGRRVPTVWTPEQLGRFLHHVEGDRLYGLWLLAATTGMRRGELCGLEWSDVDFERGRLTVRRNRVMVAGRAQTHAPKTAAGERTISLDTATLGALRARRAQEQADQSVCPPGHWRDNDCVFRDTLGRPIFPESLSKRFRALVHQGGLPPIRLHDIRHSYATAALQAGASIETLSDRLGHSTSAVTRAIYLHPVEELDRQMADSMAELILGRPLRTERHPSGRSGQP
ncbi:MAG TPA: tyrosine-type recombinase/integrase [Acidimicrobiales bacterium]|nr:tyrosine-type recombinase/integrase [Acidimicrobiales bacterium]